MNNIGFYIGYMDKCANMSGLSMDGIKLDKPPAPVQAAEPTPPIAPVKPIPVKTYPQLPLTNTIGENVESVEMSPQDDKKD